jgi:antitoxin component YwqK of YwqJK toxin-antitoxin module
VHHGPTWISYEDGSLASYGIAVHGVLEDIWLQWHRNGVKASETEFRNGELVGRFRRWDESGRLQVEGQHDPNGQMHGTWRRWWDNGQLRLEWNMDHGRHQGVVRAWHQDGQQKMAGERSEGRRHGQWTYWTPDGGIDRSCRYEQGQLVEGDCRPRPVEPDQ